MANCCRVPTTKRPTTTTVKALEHPLVQAWKRNLKDLQGHRHFFHRMGILENESAFLLYLEILEAIDSARSKGKVRLNQCPSSNAWEGSCQEPASIVSLFCAKHAAIYDDRQMFFTICTQCKAAEPPGCSNPARDNVAFYYHQKSNLCLMHQTKVINSRKKPLKRRQSGQVLEVLKIQQRAVASVIAQYLEQNATSTSTSTLPSSQASRNPCVTDSAETTPVAAVAFSPIELTPPASPTDCSAPYASIPPWPCSSSQQDEVLNLPVDELIFDAPMAQADFKAVLDDIFEPEEEDLEEAIMGNELFLDAIESLTYEVAQEGDSLSNRMDWTLQVLDEMEWRSNIEIETLR
ncbi:hypothetical protein BV898_11626 [Hypsibius exemplaris]|uniref:Potential DNA-binding domain-containing protein n=1 Tax=Hypsibius exemplaris TaxID=2072580 RepID=A0A1W0WG97_HYPEX|nr:hypothetical protein BV898_11626 [Hypsibius exemplaris]